MILMKYHTLIYFFRKLEKMLQNLSSAAVVIGALRVKVFSVHLKEHVSFTRSNMESHK